MPVIAVMIALTECDGEKHTAEVENDSRPMRTALDPGAFNIPQTAIPAPDVRA